MKRKQGISTIMLGLLVIYTTALSACLPQINWGASVSFCQGNSFTLSAYNANSTYQWSTGATTSSINISSSGTYWVTVTNHCGSTSDTIQVFVDQPININLGADRKICSAIPTQLSAPQLPNTTYHWSTGATSHSISVNQSGTYYVEATNACGTYRDTVQLEAENPQNFSLGGTISRCTADSVWLSLPSGTTGNPMWNDGSQGDSLLVTSSGKYWVTVVNACGHYSDTAYVNFLIDSQMFPFDSVGLCTGGQVTLNSPVSAQGYQWSNGASTSSISVNQPGTYWLRLQTQCGFVYDTVKVYLTPGTQVDLGLDTTFCAVSNLTLDAGNPGSTYLWSTGAKSKTINVSSSGQYWVGVDNGCGYVYDSIQVTADPVPVISIDDTIYVCQGQNAPVQDAGFWGAQTGYLWSNSQSTRLGSGLGPGAHWVKVWNACDTVHKDFYVKAVNPINLDLGPDIYSCNNSVWLDPGLDPHANSFQWNTGSKGRRIRARNTGVYWLQVTNACGTYVDTIQITLTKKPGGIAEDTIYKCQGFSRAVSAPMRPNTYYQWSTGDTTSYTLATAPGLYSLMAYNDCDTIYDSVRVFDDNPLPVHLGPDTTFCRPAVLSFDFSHFRADSMIWNGKDHGTQLTINRSGTYWVEAYNACGVFTDSVVVNVLRPPRRTLRDTAYCQNTSVTLDASQSWADNYLWNTGDTTASIVVNQTGWYKVTLSNPCNTIRDSAFVRADFQLPAIDLGPDTIFCAGTLDLDPGNVPGAFYRWQNGDTSRVFTVTKSGTYYVEMYNTCNVVYDSIDVLITGPPSLTLGNNVRFCRGSALNLNAQNPGSSYLWSTGDTTQMVSINDPGRYWVTITNDCGSLTDSIDVIVEDPLDSILSLGVDTVICRGDSLLLDVRIPGTSAKWQNGATTSSIYVKNTGDYWVEVTNTCGTWEDTIHVEVLDVPQFSLGEDAVFCAAGGQVNLEGPENMDSYLWSTGATSRTEWIDQEGIYWLTVTNACFSYTDTIVVEEDYPLPVNFGPDTLLCHGEMLTLHAPMGARDLLWSDNTEGHSMEVTRSGVYWLQATNACGTYGDTIRVQVDQHLDPEPVEITVCREDTTYIDLSGLKHEFTWFDGSTEARRGFAEEGLYSLYIRNRCGEYRKDYEVKISHCDCPFFIPNAFTPNGDGRNDEFAVGHSCDLTGYRLQIFNRWGNLVYESQDAGEGWDGRVSGQEQPAGIYTYSIHYQWRVYGDLEFRTKSGTLTLVR